MDSITLADIGMVTARVLVSSVFISSGIDKIKGSPRETENLRSLGVPAPATLNRLAGVCELVGAAMLVLGVGARIGAVLLAAFIIIVSLIFLRYWQFKGPPEGRRMQKYAFVGNLALVGGLVAIVADGPGRLALLPGF